MNRTTKLLCELIALPSVNPAFVPAGDPRAGERTVAEFVASVAGQGGLDVEFRSALPGRPNLLARLSPGQAVQQRVVLAPHLDTVGATEEQLRPAVKAGRVYGRGACDTKGSVAAMLGAMLELAHGGQRPRSTEIVLAALVDEENAQAGSRALVAGGFQADLAIVGEATRLKVVTAHKGSLWLQLETRGRSAHGARPALGVNAVHRMARVVEHLEMDYARALAGRRHPLLGSPTVSVGTICGGSQANIVPDRCAITVDRRTIPGETEAAVVREIRRELRRRGLKVEISSGKNAPCLAMETNPNRPLVRRLMRTVGQRKPCGVHYFCDASVLALGGIPSVVFGPGDIAQAHTAEEWISEESLERGRRLLASFLRGLP